MTPAKQRLLDIAFECQALQFGKFQLKSGRQSPYFFNGGALMANSTALAALGAVFADGWCETFSDATYAFGAAYKGIPLVSALAVALSARGVCVDIGFNRKEVKRHGEGGDTVGAPLKGRKVVVVDDVLTAGTALLEVRALLAAHGASLAGVLLVLDRMEVQNPGDMDTAVGTLSAAWRIPITSALALSDISAWLTAKNTPEHRAQYALLQAHQNEYGVQP